MERSECSHGEGDERCSKRKCERIDLTLCECHSECVWNTHALLVYIFVCCAFTAPRGNDLR